MFGSIGKADNTYADKPPAKLVTSSEHILARISLSPRQRNPRVKTADWPVAEDYGAAVGLYDRLGDR
jgi:hypothetical protein